MRLIVTLASLFLLPSIVAAAASPVAKTQTAAPASRPVSELEQLRAEVARLRAENAALHAKLATLTAASATGAATKPDAKPDDPLTKGVNDGWIQVGMSWDQATAAKKNGGWDITDTLTTEEKGPDGKTVQVVVWINDRAGDGKSPYKVWFHNGVVVKILR